MSVSCWFFSPFKEDKTPPEEMLMHCFIMHGVCTILHLASVTANHKGLAVLSSLLMTIKTITFIVTIMMLQAFLLGNKGSVREDIKKSWLDKFMSDLFGIEEFDEVAKVVFWLIYQLIIFYASIISIVILMIISQFRRFNLIRDRIGLSSPRREKFDYLLYIKDDIHWFIICITQTVLLIIASFALEVYLFNMRKRGM